MPKKKSFITLTDQFCGCGGSSQGARNLSIQYGGGLEVSLALNHWKLAIETHNTNFPDTLHDCTDISACDPRRYGSTDILITSPECTNHALAKGKKRKWLQQAQMFGMATVDPEEERSRATMWDVPRFAEYHNYNLIIVENVVDARHWVMFEPWLQAMHALGYAHQCCYLNSMHFFPCPQSRDRMYVVFWKKKNKAPDLNFTPLAFCHKCNTNVNSVQTWKDPNKKWGKYRFQYLFCCPQCTSVVEPYYYAAFNCIDWSIPGTRIGDRKKPLQPNTLKRIQHGIDKYWNEPIPLIVTGRYGSGIDCRVRESTRELPTQPGSNAHYLLNPAPLYVYMGHTKSGDKRSYPITDALGAQTGRNNYALLNPFFVNLDHSKAGNLTSDSADALRTQATTQVCGFVHPPLVIQNMSNGKGKPADRPVGGICTVNTHGLLYQPLMIENKGQSLSRPSTDALSSQTTKPHAGLLYQPFLVDLHRNGMTRPGDSALSTVTAGGIKNGLVTAEQWNSFIDYYYGSSLQTSHITEAVDSLRTKAGQNLISMPMGRPNIEDCYYRMLKAHEIKIGMAFNSDYIVLGNQEQQVKQLGNAVTPPVMTWLLDRGLQTLKG